MAITRKESRAVLAIIWEYANEAWRTGYVAGRDGAEATKNPYGEMAGSPFAADKISNEEIDVLVTQIGNISKHFNA